MQTNSLRNKIILIGFMGTGKSAVADGLASVLELHKHDVDVAIVKHAGQPISDIFAQSGEETFRNIETEVLQELLYSPEASIIATGGGAVLKQVNRDTMLEHGLVIHLIASADVIISRVKHDTGRPLLQGDVTERVHQLMSARAGAYDFAHYSIDTSNLSLPEVVSQIVELWHQANLK
ncbi:shikimate kinase [Paenibacillus endoradicis]|uniref:shikimate kinase n=1 Tax=Paenibacillus endoradicis TaxID=2972487 RepID=UPI002158BF9F|nr:shikimate kinase [Paenibacillus endoradicis]MCR8656052.1 shikimate kinase [Paenibacillus endoradicis]MCR8658378.1 shikimate kinase [Paenibacillus endoradicis]